MEPGTSASNFGDEVFSLKDALQVVRRRIWVIALTVIVFLVAALGLSLLQTPRYEASIMVLVGQDEEAAGTPNLGGDVQGLQQFTQTLTEAVQSRPVAEAVIQDLNLEVTPETFLENRLTAQQISETQFIEVSYVDSSPERAQRVANSVGAVFSSQVSEVGPDASGITATVWEAAGVPENPVSPDPVRYALLALVLGGVLGLGLAFLLEYLNEGWNSPREVEQTLGLPAFGTIPAYKPPMGKRKD